MKEGRETWMRCSAVWIPRLCSFFGDFMQCLVSRQLPGWRVCSFLVRDSLGLWFLCGQRASLHSLKESTQSFFLCITSFSQPFVFLAFWKKMIMATKFSFLHVQHHWEFSEFFNLPIKYLEGKGMNWEVMGPSGLLHNFLFLSLAPGCRRFLIRL